MTSNKSAEQLELGEKGYVKSRMIFKENDQCYIEDNALVLKRDDSHSNILITYTEDGFIAKTIESNVGKRYIDSKTKKCLSDNIYPVNVDIA